MTDLTEYQRSAVTKSGHRILIGARQIGKTESVVQVAVDALMDGDRAVVLAYRYEMAQNIGTRIREALEDMGADYRSTRTRIEADGRVDLFSAQQVENVDRDLPRQFGIADIALVDEANHIDPEVLFRIEHEGPSDVLLTATPIPKGSIVSMWAAHSPYWTTYSASMDDVPFIIDDGRIEEHRKTLSHEQAMCEIEGDYESVV